MKKGDILILVIDRSKLASIGVATYEGIKIDVPNTYSGDRVEVRVLRAGRKKRVKFLKRHYKDSVNIDCKLFDMCGGCSSMHVPLHVQRENKKIEVVNHFKNNGIDLQNIEIVGGEQYRYRNKVEFTFGDPFKDGPLNLGFHQRNMGKNILDTDECMLISRDFQKIRDFTEAFYREKKISHYNIYKHDGVLRHLVIRRSVHNKEIMVNLVSTSSGDVYIQEYKNGLLSLELEDKIVSILHTINNSLSDAVLCDELRVIHGRDYITENLLGMGFDISPFSFFQTNTLMAEVMFKYLVDIVKTIKPKVCFDLYCGTGVISNLIGENATELYGIEIVNEAVEKAKENAKKFGNKNITYYCGDVKESVKKINKKADMIIVDPPRMGIHPRAIDDIINIGSEHFLYVSCNPKTLAIDLQKILSSGYEIKSFKLFDLYPNTPHVEAVVLLERN